MPSYDFLNEETKEVKSLFFHMNDKKEYTDEKGYKWTRLFCSPQAAIDTKWDAESSKDFAAKTKAKKGTMGDLFDKSAELSEKRKNIMGGEDPVKKSHWDNWSKKRGGRKAPEFLKNQL